jgi:hypothetical protein
VAPGVERKLARLQELVDSHNAYYPIEANLPSSPRTLMVMDGGVPWRPRPVPTLEALAASARKRLPP